MIAFFVVCCFLGIMTHDIAAVAVQPNTDTDPQMALALFQELLPSGISIAESPTDVGFHINQILVDVTDLTVLARRALMGCYYLAATAPLPENRIPGSRPVFRADLGLYKWLINYASSNNNDYLKEALTKAQKTLIQMNVVDADNPAKDFWASVHLMGDVTIGNGEIVFDLPQRLADELSNPSSRNGVVMYLSLRIQAGFTSIHAQTLYAKVAHLGDCYTQWMSLDEFAEWMRVKPTEYKYLKRDVIGVAIQQINDQSNLTVTLETQKTPKSRSVAFLRLKVARKNNWMTSVNEMEQETAIYQTLRTEFGMGQADLEKVRKDRTANQWPTDRILDAIEYTRARLSDSTKEVIRRPGNYFQKALQEGWSLGTTTVASLHAAQQTKSLLANERDKVRQASDQATVGAVQGLHATIERGQGIFAALSEDDQEQLWARFRMNRTARPMISGIEKANGGATMARDRLISDPKIAGLWWGFVEKNAKVGV